VGLVEDDEAKVIRRQSLEQTSGRGLDRREDVLPALGRPAIGPKLAEGRVAHDVAKGGERLFEDLPAVRQEEEPGPQAHAIAGPCVVEGGDDRLASPGGRDHQVAVPVMELPLGVETVEDLLLERERSQIEEERSGVRGRLLRVEGGLHPPAVALCLRVIVLELGIAPEAVEGATELVDHVGQVGGAELHHPLLAAAEGGRGEVGGADVRGV
jgi:hypothetical protein